MNREEIEITIEKVQFLKNEIEELRKENESQYKLRKEELEKAHELENEILTNKRLDKMEFGLELIHNTLDFKINLLQYKLKELCENLAINI